MKKVSVTMMIFVALFLSGCFEPTFNVEPPKHTVLDSDVVKSTGNRVSNKYIPDSIHGDDKVCS
jgi:PBP1b-binding outer membrane lipoprotein LpoB